MKRIIILVLSLLVPVAARAAIVVNAAAQIQGMTNQRVTAYAQAECRDSNTGQIVNCLMNVTFGLLDLGPSSSIYPIRLFETRTGTYSGTIGPYQGAYGHCYQSTIDVFLNSVHVASAASQPQCFEYVEMPDPDRPPNNCPIVLDLGKPGLELGSLAQAVSFDIDADGDRELLTWTAAGASDALLALDRNGNGTIDDGAELFGWATPLATGARAQVGYAALAELDANADGLVDANDPAFARLRAWTDANHDGISQAAELQTLAHAGVVGLEYAYTESGRRDQDGNLLRYRARAFESNGAGNVRAITTWDVIFAGR